jgi:hypothetical protein
MRRLLSTLAGVLGWIWLLATESLAQYPPSKPPPTGTGEGTSGGVAFTGTSISLGVVILIGLVILGAVLYVMGRRRRVTAAA